MKKITFYLYSVLLTISFNAIGQDFPGPYDYEFYAEYFLPKKTVSCSDSLFLKLEFNENLYQAPFNAEWTIDPKLNYTESSSLIQNETQEVSLMIKTSSLQKGWVKVKVTDANNHLVKVYTNAIINGYQKNEYEAGWSSAPFREEDGIELASNKLFKTDYRFYFLQKPDNSIGLYSLIDNEWKVFQTSIKNADENFSFLVSETSGYSHLFYTKASNLFISRVDKSTGNDVGEVIQTSIENANSFVSIPITAELFQIYWLSDSSLFVSRIDLLQDGTAKEVYRIKVADNTQKSINPNGLMVYGNRFYYTKKDGGVYYKEKNPNVTTVNDYFLEEVRGNGTAQDLWIDSSSKLSSSTDDIFYFSKNKLVDLNYYDGGIAVNNLNDSLPESYQFYTDGSVISQEYVGAPIYFNANGNIYTWSKSYGGIARKATHQSVNDACAGDIVMVDKTLFYVDSTNKIRQLIYPYLDDYTNCLPVGLHSGYTFNGFQDVNPFLGLKEENNLSRGSVSPNPTNNFVKVEACCNDNGTRVLQVFNLHGQQLLEQEYNFEATNIDLSGFDAGIYIVKVSSDEFKNQVSFKVVKQ